MTQLQDRFQKAASAGKTLAEDSGGLDQLIDAWRKIADRQMEQNAEHSNRVERRALQHVQRQLRVRVDCPAVCEVK
jgi:hypothetical protein